MLTEKNEEILALKGNIEAVREMDAKINVLLTETIRIRTGLSEMLAKSLPLYNGDYLSLEEEQKYVQFVFKYVISFLLPTILKSKIISVL